MAGRVRAGNGPALTPPNTAMRSRRELQADGLWADWADCCPTALERKTKVTCHWWPAVVPADDDQNRQFGSKFTPFTGGNPIETYINSDASSTMAFLGRLFRCGMVIPPLKTGRLPLHAPDVIFGGQAPQSRCVYKL